MNRHALLASLLLGTLCACGSSSEASSAEALETANPTGADATGSLVVELPAGFSASDVSDLHVDTQSVTPGQILTGLPVGNHCVRTNGLVDCQVVVQSKQTTTYALAAVKTLLPKEPTFGINAHPFATRPEGSDFGNDAVRVTFFGVVSDDVALFQPPKDGEVRVLPHGRMQAEWGYTDGIASFDLPGGQLTVLDLGAPAGRRLVRLHAPSSRALPNPANGEQAANWSLETLEGRVLTRVATFLPMTASSTLVVGIGEGRDFAPINLRLPLTAPRELTFAAAGTGPLDQNIGRIDVTDVTVENGDGSTGTEKGTYSVIGKTLIDGQHVQLSDLPTQTGIDVWPDDYTIRTSYTTASGPTVDERTVTIH